MLGAFLRVIRLDSLPPSLFRDEAEKAYNAYSLLKTGKDVSGEFLPLFINVFGVTTSAIYQYVAVPFVWLFGLTEWSARLPAVTVGVLTLVVNYAWVRRARGADVARWATVFLALSPWHVVFSRWAQQGVFLPLLLSGGMYFFTCFVQGRRWLLPFAAACFALSIYAYDVARLFVPAMMFVLLFCYWRELGRRWVETLSSFTVFALLISPVLQLILFQPDAAQARFRAISIFTGNTVPQSAILFLKNYLTHFSPGFLLLHGDAELRHGAGVGVLTAVELVCMLIGLCVLARARRREDWVWVGWILLFPAAASLTKVGIPHALRSIVAVPLLQNVAAVGAVAFISAVRQDRRRAVAMLTFLAVLVSFLPFANAYYMTYAQRSASHWQYGVKEAVQAHRKAPPGTKLVFHHITGAEYLAAFYAKLPPGNLPLSLQDAGYEFSPFNHPLDHLVGSAQFQPQMILTLPYPVTVEGVKTLPIHAPGSTEEVARLIFNRPLVAILEAQAKPK